MRRWLVVATAAAVVLGTMAAPASAQEAPDGVQIVIVLDVSGSMGEFVLDDDLPLEIRSILDQITDLVDRMAAIDEDPAVVELRDEIDRLEQDPDLVALDAAFGEAAAQRESWLMDQGYGEFDPVVAGIRDHLASLGCDEFGYASIMGAEGFDDADQWIDQACAAVDLSEAERQSIYDLVAFVEDPDFQALDRAVDDAFDAWFGARGDLGIGDLQVRLHGILEDGDYYGMSDRIVELEADLDDEAAAAGYPRKLEVAQLAAHTLLDLSELDRITGLDTSLALVVFSTEPELVHRMTDDLAAVGDGIDELLPLTRTNLGGGMTTALDELERVRDPELPAAIILLSDGHSNEGISIPEILDRVPQRAGELDTIVCSAGFATTEEEVDADLLEGLADETDGQYLFVTTGDELPSFFVACRQGLLGSVLETTTAVATAAPVTAAVVRVPSGTCSLEAVVSFVDRPPAVRLIGPDGSEAEADAREGGNVMLLTVADPVAGDWTAEVSSGSGDVLYSIVLSVEECAAAPPTTVAPAAPPADDGGGSAGLVIVIVILLMAAAGAAVWWFLIRPRRNGEEPGTG